MMLIVGDMHYITKNIAIRAFLKAGIAILCQYSVYNMLFIYMCLYGISLLQYANVVDM